MYVTITFKFPHKVPDGLIERIRRQIPVLNLFTADRLISFETPVGMNFRNFMDCEIHTLTTTRQPYSITIETQ